MLRVNVMEIYDESRYGSDGRSGLWLWPVIGTWMVVLLLVLVTRSFD